MDEKKDRGKRILTTELPSDWKTPKKLSQTLLYDSSESELEDDIKPTTSDKNSSMIDRKQCLFYHSDDQESINLRHGEYKMGCRSYAGLLEVIDYLLIDFLLIDRFRVAL